LTDANLKVLIAYGTCFGSTAGTAEEIGKVLVEEGFEVKLANLKEEKIQDLSEYNVVVVGSGMKMGHWVSEAEDFLKKFQSEFNGKKLAIFASTLKTAAEREGKTGQVAKIRKAALEDKVAKYHLEPIALGFFGGVLDYNKMGFFERKAMGLYKPQLERDGFKETRPGIYDLRDWNEIKNWAEELAQKAKEQG